MQEVIEAMAMDPWRISEPSGSLADAFIRSAATPKPPWWCETGRAARKRFLISPTGWWSWGFLGPAMADTTLDRSSSIVRE